MPTVLISAPYILPFMDRFQPVFERHQVKTIIAEVDERLNQESLLSFAGQFDGTICGDDDYTQHTLEACAPRLKIISKWGTGIDSIDKSAADNLGIKVCRTANAFSHTVADSVLGYIIAFSRQLPWMDRAMKSGQWQKIPGRTLSECSLGVIGVGNIGKAVIQRARAFNMELLGNDIIEIDPGFVSENGVEMTSLEYLLNQADFVSLNCDLNPTSYHLIDSEKFNWMKPSAVLINMSRGQVVDEPELIQALQNKLIAGAALDVFEEEPLPHNSPLMQMDNVMLAPHNGNSSPTAWENVHWNTIRNLFIGLDIKPDF
ncbi:phosphoglycerate dehydrogenase [Chloroflexota bacterium]